MYVCDSILEKADLILEVLGEEEGEVEGGGGGGGVTKTEVAPD